MNQKGFDETSPEQIACRNRRGVVSFDSALSKMDSLPTFLNLNRKTK